MMSRRQHSEAQGRLRSLTDRALRRHACHNATVQNDPLQETDDYWQGNARVRHVPSSKHWEFTAFVNNVTDEAPVYLRQTANPSTQTQPNSIIAPQTWGVQTTVRF